MELILTQAHGKKRDVTSLYQTITWSGDKRAISRSLHAILAAPKDGEDLPRVATGDGLFLALDGKAVFSGKIYQRSQKSEEHTADMTAFDGGYRLGRNDGTYRFSGASPEAITRTVCADYGFAVASLPTTRARIRRIFAGVPLSKIIQTVWTLAEEQTDTHFAIYWTPDGLVVRERGISTLSPILRPRSNLMDATVREDASRCVSRVAIYDQHGNRLRTIDGDGEVEKLLGVMERHIKQSKNGGAEADANAKRLLEEGRIQQSVSVNVMGDPALITGETVVVEEEQTGLSGIFWVEADRHTWKNGQYFTALDLNCRNVSEHVTAGSEKK